MPQTRTTSDDRRRNLEERVAELLVENAQSLAAQIVAATLEGLRDELQPFRALFGEGAESHGGTQRVPGTGAPARVSRNRRLRAPAAGRIRKCVAPGCTNDNRGPRFGYCCKEHESAPQKQKEAWRRDYLEAEQAQGPPNPELVILAGVEEKILGVIASQGKNGVTAEELRRELKLTGPKLSYHIKRLSAQKRLHSDGPPNNRRHFTA